MEMAPAEGVVANQADGLVAPAGVADPVAVAQWVAVWVDRVETGLSVTGPPVGIVTTGPNLVTNGNRIPGDVILLLNRL